MRISDWSSDVCSSDLVASVERAGPRRIGHFGELGRGVRPEGGAVMNRWRNGAIGVEPGIAVQNQGVVLPGAGGFIGFGRGHGLHVRAPCRGWFRGGAASAYTPFPLWRDRKSVV